MAAIAAAYPILTSMAAGVVGTVAASALAPKPGGTPPPPTLTAPTVMPTPGDDAARAAKRQSLADQMARQGRASTILTDQSATSDKLGG